jgi:hypothetical protein
MAADDERAQRISALKDDRPDLTWRRIADAVGVSERAAFEWKKSGGIDYENAKKLADVFEVDVDYIWRGRETADTPDLSALQGAAREEQLDGVSAEFSVRVDNVEAALERIEASIEQARNEREDQAAEIRRLLAEQSELLAVIRGLLGMDSEVTLQDRLVQMLRDAQAKAGPGPAPRSVPQDRS